MDMDKRTRVDLQQAKSRGERLVVVTAYDHASARIVDAAGVDAILVGDSLGMVVQGHDSTLPVTLEHVIYHTQCVVRAKPRAHVVADLPFGTFQRGADAALDAALRLVQEAGAEAVKLEGAGPRLAGIEAIAAADVPVWGHVGLTPQSIHAFGGYRVQGRDDASRHVLQAARDVENAGAAVLVLEAIPHELAGEITEALSIPTIGIGAGPRCDGQVLVFHDLLGFDEAFRPRFVKRYAAAFRDLTGAVEAFATEVRDGIFPTLEHSYADRTRDGKRVAAREENDGDG